MYKRIGLAVVSTAIALSVVGCGRDMDNSTRELDRHINGVRMQSTRNENDFIGQRAARNDTSLNDRDIDTEQEDLLHHVRNVNGVKDATLFVNGSDVVVGLDLVSTDQRAEVENKVRRAIEEARADYNIHITSDADMHDRIRQIKGQMIPMDGHPIRNMAEDIRILLGDMTLSESSR